MSTIIKPNRRTVIKGIAGTTLALAAPAIWSSAARAQTNRLTVGDSGGNVTTAFGDAFYRPYFEETGIEIVPVERRESPAAEIRAVVETGSYKWDFCEGIGNDVVVPLEDDGLLEELDLSGETEAIPDALKTPHFIASNVVAFVLAYRTDKFASPVHYADVWDVEGFPGRRGLRQNARDTLQIALVADGVFPADVSKVLADEAGWARAFAKLDEIKPHINVWWSAAAQTPTLLQTGEVDICPTFNQRAQSVIDEGSPVAITWDGSFYNNYGWVIPKGSPKADLARNFIKWCSDPQRQAAAGEALGFAMSNPNAMPFISPERARTMATYPDNIRNMALIDFRFWGPIQEEATTRFNDWLLG